MLVRTHRRAFLANATAAALVGVAASVGAWLVSSEAGADTAKKRSKAEKIKKVETTTEGVLFTLALDRAPYPTADSKYTDDTVLVFVPTHYRLPESGAVDWLVHFHGHRSTAGGALTHRLREQLHESKQNAVLVVPQGPTGALDGDFGKLMKKNGLARMLDEARSVISSDDPSKKLGDASLAGAEKTNRVLLSAHSGGYLAAAACVKRSGTDVREVYLFDALYDEVATFREWMVESPKKRKIVSYCVSEKPRENTTALLDALSRAGIKVVREEIGKKITRQQLTKARGVMLSGSSSHSGADWEEAVLRNCLLASCLPGKGSAAWHKDKDATR